MQRAFSWEPGPSYGATRPAEQAIWNLQEESQSSGRVPSLPGKGPRGKSPGLVEELAPRESRPGGVWTQKARGTAAGALLT